MTPTLLIMLDALYLNTAGRDFPQNCTVYLEDRNEETSTLNLGLSVNDEASEGVWD